MWFGRKLISTLLVKELFINRQQAMSNKQKWLPAQLFFSSVIL
jgi:hypothetical protein